MKPEFLCRITWVVVAWVAVFLLFIPQAQAAFPDRPVTLLVGFSPGGSMDLSARALAKSAEAILGQPVVVENKPGGTGTVALAALLAHKPDGYTLCATPSSVLIRVSQIQQVPFTPLTSFKPIIGFTEPQLGLVVKSDAPWKTLKDLVDDAEKNPNKITFATTGVGSTTHAAVDAIAGKDRLHMIHVPFKGSMEALGALLGGHVEFASLTSELIPAVKSGQARLLAVISERRSPKFPDVPTLKESGYDFANDAVFAVMAPSDMDPAIAAKLEAAFAAAIKTRDYLDVLDRLNMIPVYYDGRAFDDFLRVHWKRINRHLISTGVIKEAATSPE
ncbi:MAG: tripartite tricarboxylate transporter substrate binding protein [Smithellaceae bacterium]